MQLEIYYMLKPAMFWKHGRFCEVIYLSILFNKLTLKKYVETLGSYEHYCNAR
jgi:hypothetical protein